MPIFPVKEEASVTGSRAWSGTEHGQRIQIFTGIVVVTALLFSSAGRAQGNPSLSEIFQNALACSLVEPLMARGEPAQLFTLEESLCVSVGPNENRNADYYQDAACSIPVNFSPTSLYSYCELLLDPSTLGEGDGIVPDQWTLSPGTRLDLGARTLDDVAQPYLQRTIYRNVDTAGGTCNLEMRIYSPRPGITQQGSLLAFHGGSWSARGFGFFGLELTIPHFVEQGFVVFAPFYRLLGTSEGSTECNNSSITQIVEDAEAALEWVRVNASTYGGTEKPVVFGQSAGAHLALSLAVNQSESVVAGVLLYPPTDFTDFALRVQNGFYKNTQGVSILERVIGLSAAEADLNASPIPENSFPIRIVESGLKLPPLLMIHGMADDLVEARQSIRMCDALAGRELLAVDAPTPSLTQLREFISCGEGSSLQLIREGKHALDVCVADIRIATDLCPSGSSQSRQEVSLAITDAATFASDAVGSQLQPAARSGGGAASLLAFIGLFLSLSFRLTRLTRTHLSN
ncbi:alpha/beta hydrolase [Granulosicoccus sp.]|nr:alpha/beta hydrolase [Granulosicoccus sp.]MDB4223463.1 alpha/beta hydrolase [Granulosicoccus sp.]